MTGSSSVDPRSPTPRLAFNAAAVAIAALRPADPFGVFDDVKDRFSIRVAEQPGECTLCAEPTGTGPVGYYDDRPVCDLCLLDCCVELGLVLALVTVVRGYGAVEADSHTEHSEDLAKLGFFARIYEQLAAMSAPARRMLPEPKLT